MAKKTELWQLCQEKNAYLFLFSLIFINYECSAMHHFSWKAIKFPLGQISSEKYVIIMNDEKMKDSRWQFLLLGDFPFC